MCFGACCFVLLCLVACVLKHDCLISRMSVCLRVCLYWSELIGVGLFCFVCLFPSSIVCVFVQLCTCLFA